jgi:hypothetical protein
MSRIRTEITAFLPPSRPPLDVQKQSRQIPLYRRSPHTLNLFAAFLMLAVVAPATSASLFSNPSFLNDASHSATAETHGFLQA